MYVPFVALTMLILPLASIVAEHALHPAVPITILVGRWFVFWSVGVRLTVAGLRQFFQPAYTDRKIFHANSDDVLPLIRELGVANVSTGLVGLLSLAAPSFFVLPVAISAGFFYGVAGVRHVAERHRSLNENIAMVSDLFMAAVLLLSAGILWLRH
jgi:hypothetical protein